MNILKGNHSPDRAELFKALCASQSEMPIIGKNKSGRFKYADMAQVVFETRPILTSNGLCVIQDFMATEDGGNYILTTLAHNSGQFQESIFCLPKRDQGSIPNGSTLNNTIAGDITYYKRYTYCAMVGCVISDEDFDGDPTASETRETRIEMISKDQLDQLHHELADNPDIAKRIMAAMQISSLSEMPKSRFLSSITRIREIKSAGNSSR